MYHSVTIASLRIQSVISWSRTFVGKYHLLECNRVARLREIIAQARFCCCASAGPSLGFLVQLGEPTHGSIGIGPAFSFMHDV